MLVALDCQGIRVDAADVSKSDGPFLCPACSEEVMLKKGEIKIHHFSHFPGSLCGYGSGETEEHRLCKRFVYNELKHYGHSTLLEMEHWLGSIIPDVYVEFGPVKVAFEIQNSSISNEMLRHKALFYRDNSIYILWLVPWRGCLRKDTYSPAAWEKWIHQLYYGNVYYIKPWDDSFIHPVSFGVHWLYKDGGDYGSSYSYRSKRYRTPYHGDDLRLIGDFKRHKKKADHLALVPGALILKHAAYKKKDIINGR